MLIVWNYLTGPKFQYNNGLEIKINSFVRMRDDAYFTRDLIVLNDVFYSGRNSCFTLKVSSSFILQQYVLQELGHMYVFA
jgi:hypothetical protein